MEVETTEKQQVIYGSFLEDRIVSVKPVESLGKWSTLLVKGQEKNKDPFLYNKIKRSFQVPLNPSTLGGGIKVILDDQRKVKIIKYKEKFPEGMTQREFFEQELGANLNPTILGDINFWRSDRRARVVMTKEGLKLNLNLPLGMLHYLILLSNKSLISPSYEEREKKATYEFMIVDESKITSAKIAEADIKAKAYLKYAEIVSSKDNTIGFIKSLGRAIPVSATQDWMKGEVLNVLEKDPSKFMEIVSHPQYNDRIFVQEAIDAGAILRKADKRYTLDNGIELGDLTGVVNFLLNAENQEVRLRIKNAIEVSKRK